MSVVTDLLTAKGAARTRRIPAWLRFEEEIVTQIYGPRIAAILVNNDITSVVMLARTFADDHKCTVSTKTMQKWLNICGLTPVKQMEWRGLNRTTGEIS